MNNSLPKLLNWAVVGLGVGEQHARRLAGLGNCHLVYLYDYDRAKAQHLADELHVDKVAASYEEILADSIVNAVAIASYDDDHFAQVVSALDAGKHVFAEKPLCRTGQELAQIKQAWDRHAGRLRLTSNLVLRAAPAYQWLKQQREAGALGRIYSFDGEYLYGRLSKITDGWRKDIQDYSVMMGGGIHLVDLMLWVTGERPTEVTAFGNRICTEGTAFCYNDFVTAVFTFPSGTIGRINANFGCVHPHQHVVRVFGTQATFLYDDEGPRWFASRDPSQTASRITLPALPAHKGDLLPAVVADILSAAEHADQTRMVFDVLSVCIAADQAMRLNTSVRIEYL